MKPDPKLSRLQGPPLALERLLLERTRDIEAWFRRQWLDTPAPFYCSVDLRNAGYKLAPVDTNLFPAGFNNLNPELDALCIHALQTAVERVCPTAANILLVPELHTRNQFYLESLGRLHELLNRAGFNVRIGWLDPELKEAKEMTTAAGRKLWLEPIERDGDSVYVGDFVPCSVLLNNDLSGGRPALLENISQPVIPPLDLGWSNRLKSQHFAVYDQVAREFAGQLEIDPWLINPLVRNCGQINFMKNEGLECLSSNVEMLLGDIAQKYQQYGIEDEPFVIVKADAGTYGMAIMTVKSPDDLSELNRKQRSKMSATKEGREVTGAILQEGVYTRETFGNGDAGSQAPGASAEPVVYMIDHYVVGGFYRVHAGRSATENLNAPGMEFQPLPFDSGCDAPGESCQPGTPPNRFYAYGVVARLALAAAAREIAQSRVNAQKAAA
ncbi:MAG: glutamate--cysteine ligase [Nevskiales bacterium]